MSAGSDGERVDISTDADIVRVRQSVRACALRAALSIIDQTKIITAASELARNALVHGGGGIARIALVEENGRIGVRAAFEDTGPGIADLERALAGGISTAGSLGLGLSGSRRLVDLFALDSDARGTRVTVTKWKR